ncbi:elongation factor Ts [Pigmentiphaga litoralis]|jgi:elongation factor Ts|uniref:translation elongation factor Ts n=1 Tax=Pigmentiphaga litoralis TaxID=516702 RepID=UPI00167B0BFA|nr:translation elongation factor Ts [Pigmentiphaga litoralis]GGX02402.1 elongation factor Ts [Pigmentiphaga litoralis]
MAAITAAMVKELREKTDAPMMECKKALTEADGDLAKAEEVLRVKLGSKASKAAARVTAEGLIGLWVSDDAKLAAVVEVNSETDFVAKNDDFVAFTKEVAELIAKSNPADVDALGALAFRDSTVDTVRTGLIGKIGENITVRRFTRIATDNKVAQYVHGGRIGVLVEFSGDEALGKDLAMHIAATKPKALDTTGVSADDIQRERSVAEAKAAESGKPAEIVTKMVEGSIQKYLKEVTLLSQPFVKDDKQTVEQVLKSKGSSIQQFVLYVVGEGIEKKANDFAAEVAAQVAASKG